MDVSCLLCSIPPHFWVAVHVLGIMMAVCSRGRLGPLCFVCTNCLLTVSMVIVGVLAAVGFLCQQPFWAASGCTLGLMAVVICFERSSEEPHRLLQAIAAND